MYVCNTEMGCVWGGGGGREGVYACIYNIRVLILVHVCSRYSGGVWRADDGVGADSLRRGPLLLIYIHMCVCVCVFIYI